MALTRITKGVIKPNENYDTHNIVSTGIVTSVGLDVNGSADISGSLSVGGVLTYEDVTSIDSVGLITARSGIFVSAGSSVGIGTDNLTYPLEIHDSDPRIQLVDTDLTNNRTVQLRNSAGSFVPSASQHAIFYTGGSERVRIKSDGMVGIGTNDPQKELHILGSNPSIRIHTSNGTNVFSHLVQNGPNLKVRLRNDSSAGGMHIQGDDGTDITTLVRIQANGNVGIGTNTPAQPLEISNNGPGIRLTDTNSSAGAGTTSYTQIANINGNTYVYTRANENNGSYLIGGHADGVFTERVRILQGGGVGINTTVLPYGQFAVDHGQYGLTRFSNYSHLLLQNKNAGTTEFWTLAPRDNARFGIGRGTPASGGQISDEKFTILSNGKIGIGTVTPNENLDIQGTLAVGDNTLAVNRPRIILTSIYHGTNYGHLFGANLKVDSSSTYTTPAINISGGGWEYLAANSVNTHGTMRYLSAPDTNSSSSTPLERLRINSTGDIGINYSGTPNATLDIRTDRDPASGVMCFLRNNTNDGNGAMYGMDINGCGTWSCGMLDNSNNFSIVKGSGNSGTEYFRVASDGAVNIGSNPAQATGTNTQNAILTLKGYPGGNESSAAILALIRGYNTTSAATDHTLGRIVFGDKQAGEYAFIEGEVEANGGSVGDTPGRLVFSTAPDGTSAPTERLRISSNGKLKLSNTITSSVQSHFEIGDTQGSFDFEMSDSSGGSDFIRHVKKRFVSKGTYGLTISSRSTLGSSYTGTGDASIKFYYPSAGGGAQAGSQLEFWTNQNGYSGTSEAKRMQIDNGGNIGAPNGNNIYNASDERLKENMVELSNGLDKIKKLKPISFNWKDGWVESLSGKKEYGFGAQTTQVVDEMLVEPFGIDDALLNGEVIKNPLRVNEKYITPLLVKAIQEQQEQIETLKAEVAALKSS